MSQKNFILIFLNVSYLAVQLVAHHGQGVIIEPWIHNLFEGQTLLNIWPAILYLVILALSFAAAKDKLTKKMHAYLFTLLLLTGVTINVLFQLTYAPEFFISQSLSLIPILGCMIYLFVYPSKILQANQAKLIKSDNE